MADIRRTVFGVFDKLFRDMGDGTHAEVVAIGGTVPISGEVDVVGGLTDTELRASAVDMAVESCAVPTGAPVVGQAVIAVTGTAVALSAASVALPGGAVQVSALAANDTAGTVGGSDVTDTIDGSGNGFILEAGKAVVVIADDLADVYVNGTAGDIFTYAAG